MNIVLKYTEVNKFGKYKLHTAMEKSTEGDFKISWMKSLSAEGHKEPHQSMLNLKSCYGKPLKVVLSPKW